ncbi:MAG: methylated-DNA--[protein]-cysteine S-methyltransferase [Mariprofundales bacterium]
MGNDAIWHYVEALPGLVAYQWDGCCCQRVRLLGSAESSVAAVTTEDDSVAVWLMGYFGGAEQPLPPLATAPTGFQQRLRDALWKIPRGEVRSYGQLARDLDSSPRAVGQALGANRLPLLVPCHRVIAADSLGGFAFGMEWKQYLLALECG